MMSLESVGAGVGVPLLPKSRNTCLLCFFSLFLRDTSRLLEGKSQLQAVMVRPIVDLFFFFRDGLGSIWKDVRDRLVGR